MNINERVSTAIGLIGKRTAQLAKLEAEILALIDMDARNVSTRDGYPGGSQGPRGNSVYGLPDALPATKVQEALEWVTERIPAPLPEGNHE